MLSPDQAGFEEFVQTAQTASVLGITVGTVKSQARDGLARLRGTTLVEAPEIGSSRRP